MYVVVDFETTCWEKSFSKDMNEIIDVGMLFCNIRGEIIREFSSLVRPVINSELSPFCRNLTNIDQEDLDSASLFAEVADEIREWVIMPPGMTPEESPWMTWGSFDKRVLQDECDRNGVPMPLGHHIDIQKIYSTTRKCGEVGLQDALSREGMEFEGSPHRAICDAKNLLRIIKKIM